MFIIKYILLSLLFFNNTYTIDKLYEGKIFYNLVKFLPFQINYFYSQKMQSLVNRAYDDFQPDIVYTHLIRAAEFTKNLKSA